MNTSSLESPKTNFATHLEQNAIWWAATILLLMFGLAFTSMAQKAPTFDEQGFIVRGLSYLRGYPQIRVGHPLGLNALNASLLANDQSVDLPLNDPSFNGTSFHRPAELFLWEIGNDVRHVMFLARLPTIWLGMLLAALAGRWAWQVSGRIWPGLLALLFVALDPNILANTRLATTDLGLTAFSLLAGYTLWRFLKSPTIWRAAVAGVSLGLMQNTKFTAGLFIPLFAMVILIGLIQMWVDQRRNKTAGDSVFSAMPWRPLLMVLFIYPIVALFTLWTAYGFEIGTLPADLPMLSIISGKTLPLAHHLEQLLDIGGRLRVGTPSFLLGQYSDQGWWYYFPVSFFLKTPLPTLILLSWSIVVFVFCLIRYRDRFQVIDTASMLVPSVGYFVIGMTTDINLGYRHILPILPFAIIFAASAISRVRIRNSVNRSIIPASLLAVWLTIIALFIFPDFLAYFNILAGGPENGWRKLVDSNLDWGQDLDELPVWMAENQVDEVWLSYFGEARPEYYGIAYKGLDSFPPRLMNPQARPFSPADPAPGVYAISATNLQGVHFTNHDQFAWFREQQPLDKLGHSIFLYEVPVRGEPISLLLSGIQLDEVEPEDLGHLGGNDIKPRWIDLSQSLVIPSNSDAWLISNSSEIPHPAIAAYLDEMIVVEASSPEYQLSRFDTPKLPEEVLAEFSLDNGRIQLREMAISIESEIELTVVSAWEQNGEPQPLKIFIHILGPDGNIIAQWDGLGAVWNGWLEGDGLVQVHAITLPEEFREGDHTIAVGIYDPETGRRWQSDQATDLIELELREQ